MRHYFHLATILLLATATITHAQVTNPDDLVAPPPRPPAQHTHTPGTLNVQWMWQYTTPYNAYPVALTRDARFPALLRQSLTAPQSFWRDGALPLYQVAQRYFEQAISLASQDNRYISLSGCVPQDCPEHGLLWVDTLGSRPTVVFAARNWTAQSHPLDDRNAEFNLWLFSSRQLDPAALPDVLVTAITNWIAVTPQIIHAALLVDPDGTPHKLDPAQFLSAMPAATPAAPATPVNGSPDPAQTSSPQQQPSTAPAIHLHPQQSLNP